MKNWYPSVAIYNNKLYAVKSDGKVYEWEPTNAAAAPTLVLTPTSSFLFAVALTFDELGNLYVGDYDGDIYKYTPSAGTWGSESLLTTVSNELSWLQYAVPEPSSMLLISVGITLLMARRRTRS